eukprot:gene5364-6509_t
MYTLTANARDGETMRPLHGDGAVEKYVAGRIAARSEQHPLDWSRLEEDLRIEAPGTAAPEATRDEWDMLWEFEGVPGHQPRLTEGGETDIPPQSTGGYSSTEVGAETPPEGMGPEE